MSNQAVFYSILGGLIPAVIWLWFWLREDKSHPEPRRYIILAFIFGIISAVLVLPLEEFLSKFLPEVGILTVIVLSASEEIFKYFAAYFSSLRKKYMDEPIDAIIYMIVIALGFAALENILFLLHSIKSTGGNITQTILVGNMRFVGAALLHTVSSATIGVFIALSFYKKKFLKGSYLITGIILAVALHSFFNFFIINNKGSDIFSIFVMIWVVTILLIFLFEVVKRIKKKKKN